MKKNGCHTNTGGLESRSSDQANLADGTIDKAHEADKQDPELVLVRKQNEIMTRWNEIYQ